MDGSVSATVVNDIHAFPAHFYIFCVRFLSSLLAGCYASNSDLSESETDVRETANTNGATLTLGPSIGSANPSASSSLVALDFDLSLVTPVPVVVTAVSEPIYIAMSIAVDSRRPLCRNFR